MDINSTEDGKFYVIHYGIGVCERDNRIKHADQLERNKTSRDGF